MCRAAPAQDPGYRPTPQQAQKWRAENLRAIRFAEVTFRNVDLPLALTALAEEAQFWAGMEVIEGDDMFYGALPGPNTHRFSFAAKNTTLADLLHALAAKDPRYRFEIDDTTATVNLVPATTPPDYWAQRRIAEFGATCVCPNEAIDSLLARPELADCQLMHMEGGLGPKIHNHVGQYDLALDPVLITISPRRNWTVRHLLNLIVRKASVQRQYSWAQTTRVLKNQDGDTRRDVVIGMINGYNQPRASLNVEAVVRVDEGYRRPHWNPDNTWWR